MRQIDVHKPADSGAILAPILISVLVGRTLPLQQNFMAIAIPAVVAITAIALVTIAVARQRVTRMRTPRWPNRCSGRRFDRAAQANLGGLRSTA